jgi:ATPase subunit of ABC transporter with duplicated ATPase domains
MRLRIQPRGAHTGRENSARFGATPVFREGAENGTRGRVRSPACAPPKQILRHRSPAHSSPAAVTTTNPANAAASNPLLALANVSAGYGSQAILAGVRLQVLRGSFTALLGANGSGKTTLLKTIVGILPPLAGRVEFHPLAGHAPVIGYVPQLSLIHI